MNAALVIVKLLTERAKAMLKSVGPSSPVSRGGNWQPGTHSEAGQTSEDAVGTIRKLTAPSNSMEGYLFSSFAFTIKTFFVSRISLFWYF